MKRTKTGGALAAVANKNKIGKVVKLFPPAAMLSEQERARALALLRKGRQSRFLPDIPKGKVLEPAPTVPDAATQARENRAMGFGRMTKGSQPTSGTELLTIARHAESRGWRPRPTGQHSQGSADSR